MWFYAECKTAPSVPILCQVSITKRKREKRKQKGSMKESLLYVKLHILSLQYWYLFHISSYPFLHCSTWYPHFKQTSFSKKLVTNLRFTSWCRGSWNWLAFIILVTIIDYLGLYVWCSSACPCDILQIWSRRKDVFPTHITLFGCHQKKTKDGDKGLLPRERVCRVVLYIALW